jgi:hypothetical protein
MGVLPASYWSPGSHMTPSRTSTHFFIAIRIRVKKLKILADNMTFCPSTCRFILYVKQKEVLFQKRSTESFPLITIHLLINEAKVIQKAAVFFLIQPKSESFNLLTIMCRTWVNFTCGLHLILYLFLSKNI